MPPPPLTSVRVSRGENPDPAWGARYGLLEKAVLGLGPQVHRESAWWREERPVRRGAELLGQEEKGR